MKTLVSEAVAILDGGLRGLLAGYGEVVVHGSCTLDTMIRRDLDLYVVVPDFDVGRFFELGAALAKAGVSSHPGYGRTFSARDVYDGVLGGSVRSLADFEAYLANESPDRRR